MNCLLCGSTRTERFVRIDDRDYWRCAKCHLRFLDPDRHPAPDREKAEYDLHRNHPDDPGYREFLEQLATPLRERLSPGLHGLDYGCGPGPALAAMLAEAGHDMSIYDPFYAPDRDALARLYDFITCTETVEHFHRPAAEFERLDRMLKPGGWLGIMTRFQTDDERFAGWHYRRDPTHVVFYREESFAWIGRRFGWAVECRMPGVVLARKRGEETGKREDGRWEMGTVEPGRPPDLALFDETETSRSISLAIMKSLQLSGGMLWALLVGF